MNKTTSSSQRTIQIIEQVVGDPNYTMRSITTVFKALEEEGVSFASEEALKDFIERKCHKLSMNDKWVFFKLHPIHSRGAEPLQLKPSDETIFCNVVTDAFIDSRYERRSVAGLQRLVEDEGILFLDEFEFIETVFDYYPKAKLSKDGKWITLDLQLPQRKIVEDEKCPDMWKQLIALQSGFSEAIAKTAMKDERKAVEAMNAAIGAALKVLNAS